MKRGLLVCLAALLLGADPAQPLVAGSVRDQHGEPIAGARVVLLGSASPAASTTAADGTFVLEGTGREVRVSCSFCQATEVGVGQDGTVVAIVQRYDAPRIEGPSPSDLAHLPYARSESLFTLVPFVVRNDSSHTVPGANLRDRNAGYGGLLTLSGVPDYDIAGAVTTFDSIPQGDAGSISVARVDQGYRYGDIANAGTFSIDTTDGDSHVGFGNDTLVRANAQGPSLYGDAAYSNFQYGDVRERASAGADFSSPGTSGEFDLTSGNADVAPGGAAALFSSFSAARASVRSRGKTDAFATLLFDRGTYAYTSQHFPSNAVWSDADVSAGVASRATLAPFAQIEVRNSSASYYSNLTDPDRAEGTLGTVHAEGGLTFTQPTVDMTAAYGSVTGSYDGVLAPAQPALKVSADDALLSLNVHPGSNWLLHASASSGYTLQTIVGVYIPVALGYATPLERSDTHEATLTFNDSSRVRTSITALSWRGASGAATSSAGASVAWQIAPAVSIRTWLLREQTRGASSGMVGSTWLTYDNHDAFRIDAIWARDLLDSAMVGHLDGTVSGRLTARTHWFISSDEQRNRRSISAGIQL